MEENRERKIRPEAKYMRGGRERKKQGIGHRRKGSVKAPRYVTR